jgi:hypothetical protein
MSPHVGPLSQNEKRIDLRIDAPEIHEGPSPFHEIPGPRGTGSPLLSAPSSLIAEIGVMIKLNSVSIAIQTLLGFREIMRLGRYGSRAATVTQSYPWASRAHSRVTA